MVQPMMLHHFPFRQKTFLTFTALRVHGTAHDVCWISFSSKNVSHINYTSSSWYSPWCLLNFLFVEKRFSHLLHFEFMVQPMMLHHFPFRQKTFLTFTALRVHVSFHDVCWISFSLKNVSHTSCNIEFMVGNIMFVKFPFRQKIFLTFTALRVHGTAYDVCWISFSPKNVSHILLMF